MSDSAAQLSREFPELDIAVVEATFAEHGYNMASARAALLALTRTATSPRGGVMDEEQEVLNRSSSGSESWLSWLGLSSGTSSQSAKGAGSWNLGLDELQTGLGNVGAHLALGMKQAAHTISAYIPAELNPFVEDDEEYYYTEEEKNEYKKKDKMGVQVASPLLTKRGPAHATSPTAYAEPVQGMMDEEDEEEELSPEESKKWE